MRIKSLTLEGFTSYKKKITIDFSDFSVFVITGPNGAGKSSLVEAILFALYGKVPRVENISPLISQDRDYMMVSLEFYINGELYKIFRSYKRSTNGKVGADKIELRRWEKNTWRVISSKSKEVTKDVQRLLGINYETFTRAVIIPQNMFDKFLKEKKNRREILINLLGLSIYERIRELAKKKRDKLENEKERFHGRWDSVKDATVESVKEIKVLLDSLNTDLRECENKQKTYEKIVEKLKDLWEKEKRLLEIERELKEEYKNQKKYADLKIRIDKAKSIKELALFFNSLEDLRSSLKDEEKEIDKIEKKINSNVDCLKDLKIKKKAIFEGFGVKDEGAFFSFLEKKREVLLGIINEIETIEDTYDEFIRLRDDIKKSLKILSKIGKEYKNMYIKFKKMDEKFREAMKKERQYYTFKIVKTLKKGDRCPVCGNIYTGQHKIEEFSPSFDIDALRTEFQKMAIILEKEKTNIRIEMNNTLEKRRQMREKKKHLSKFKEKIFKTINMDISGLNLRDVEKNIQRLKKELEEKIESMREIEKNILKLESEVSLLKVDLSKRRDKYTAHIDKLKKQEEKFFNLLKEKGYDSFDDVKNFILSDEEIRRFTEDVERYNKKLYTLEERRNELLNVLKDEKGVQNRLLNAQSAYRDIQRDVKILTQKIAKEEERLKFQEKALKEKKELEEKMKKIEEEQSIYDTIISDLVSNRLPEYILTTVMDTLFEKASENLGILTQGRYTLALDERDNIVVLDMRNGGEKRSVETLSGGETFAASLALSISLRDLVQGNGILDTFFIDEGFGALDNETRAKVIEVLGALSGTGKLIGIITHVEDLAMNFPLGFRIKKMQDGSEVEIINPTV